MHVKALRGRGVSLTKQVTIELKKLGTVNSEQSFCNFWTFPSLLGLLPQFNRRRHSWTSSSPTWCSLVICTVNIVTAHMGCTHENKDHSRRDLDSWSIHPWAPKLKIEVNCAWKSCVRLFAPFWPLDTISYYVDVHVWYTRCCVMSTWCMSCWVNPGGVGQALRSMWNNYIPLLGMRKVHGNLQRLNKWALVASKFARVQRGSMLGTLLF